MPRVVPRGEFHPHQDSSHPLIQTAIKLKLITANLILFLLEGADIVTSHILQTAKITKLLEGSGFTDT